MNKTKALWIAIPVIILTAVGLTNLSNPSERMKRINSEDKEGEPLPKSRKIGKAIFYLENSGSMFGYVNGKTEYVNVVSELAEKPRFAEEKTPTEFYFVNGGLPIKLTKIGDRPSILKNKLNVNGFNCGDVTKSDLNTMFQKALAKARNDTVTILISDGIYDIGKQQAPLNVLAIEGRETRSRFIERLTEGDLQTIIVKLSSQFFGEYFPVEGGSFSMTQERPYYIWIFGESELLNEYFPEEYIKSLMGYRDVARFLKLSEINISYQVVTHEKRGNFKFDKKNKNKLIDVESDRNRSGFQFTIAVDYKGLPFSDSYLSSPKNYKCSNTNYTVNNVREIGNVKVYGLNFQPTHLITVHTEKSPYGQMDVSLQNNIPKWIETTNIDSENKIIGDTNHTFGFKFLTDAISEAYQYKSKDANIVTFSFELLK